MSEDEGKGFDWRKTTIRSVRVGLGAAGREVKRHATESIEGAKEKVNSVKDAAKAVLTKELKKFSDLPNVGLLGEAAFGLAATGVITAGAVAPLTEGLVRMATAGTSVAPAGTPEQAWAVAGLAFLDLVHIGLASEVAVITFNRIKGALSPIPVRNG